MTDLFFFLYSGVMVPKYFHDTFKYSIKFSTSCAFSVLKLKSPSNACHIADMTSPTRKDKSKEEEEDQVGNLSDRFKKKFKVGVVRENSFSKIVKLRNY